MAKKQWILFARDVSMQDVNKEFYSLKPDYQDNLWGLCLSALPEIDKKVNKIEIINGFYSRSKLFTEILHGEASTEEQIKHTEGNAIEVTWENYNPDKALEVSKIIFKKSLPNEHIKIKIYDNSLGIYRQTRESELARSVGTDKIERIILKKRGE